jgi:hypothetical protein
VLSVEQTVSAHHDLSQVEWAFHSLKTVDLQVRPLDHWKHNRIRAHVCLCMLASDLKWDLRRSLAELLFDDHEREAAETNRRSIVAPAPRSAAAKSKEPPPVRPTGIPCRASQPAPRSRHALQTSRLLDLQPGVRVRTRDLANRPAASRVRIPWHPPSPQSQNGDLLLRRKRKNSQRFRRNLRVLTETVRARPSHNTGRDHRGQILKRLQPEDRSHVVLQMTRSHGSACFLAIGCPAVSVSRGLDSLREGFVSSSRKSICALRGPVREVVTIGESVVRRQEKFKRT